MVQVEFQKFTQEEIFKKYREIFACDYIDFWNENRTHFFKKCAVHYSFIKASNSCVKQVMKYI